MDKNIFSAANEFVDFNNNEIVNLQANLNLSRVIVPKLWF